jgi:Spy/CpxP family protein refolding chaperone
MLKMLFALSLAAMPHAASAQSHQPYAGLQQRSVKALSDQQVADLKAGRGAGLALAAELNGYPGPLHVLENADELNLTAEQRQRTQALFDAMKAEAVPVGEQLIAQETRLDRLFATRQIDTATLQATTEAIALTQGRLRQTHLKYHLAMMDILSAHQIAAYRHLRGYDNGGHHHPSKH